MEGYYIHIDLFVKLELGIMTDNQYKSPWGKVPPPNQNQENTNSNFSDPFKSFNFGISTSTLIYLTAGVVLSIWLLSGFYIVDQGEQAAVTRFGKFVRVTTAGANYHIPYPIESAKKVKVDMVQREDIGFRSTSQNYKGLKDAAQTQISKFLPEESLMLTGDENVADVNFFVQWRVSNIEDYLYNVENVKDTVRSAAESSMREVIGNTTIAESLTHGKAKIQEDARKLLQNTLDGYKSGIIIENLSLLKVEAPLEVIDAFRDVQTARADKENKINQAEAYRNDIIPKARGEADEIIQQAQGYKAKITEEAKGNAAKFTNIYSQYVKAKDVTKKRMYIESMEKILTGAEKVILSGDISRSTIPYLPLKQLKDKTADAK